MVRNHEEDVPVPEDTDLYQVLGIDNDAPPEQVKSAYRKLALKHHPGMSPCRLHTHRGYGHFRARKRVLTDPPLQTKPPRTPKKTRTRSSSRSPLHMPSSPMKSDDAGTT